MQRADNDRQRQILERTVTFYILESRYDHRIMHGDKDIFAAAWLVSAMVVPCIFNVTCNYLQKQLHNTRV